MKDYNNINIIDTDRKGRPYITLASVSFASFALLQLVLSIVFALVVFIVLALGFHMLDKIGLLDTINGLLGRTMVTYTESKLIMLSGVFSIMLGIIRFLYELIHILLVNATVRMIGGIPVKLYDADSNAVRNSKKNNTVTVPADVSINANNDANSIGSKHHRVIISESHENNDDMTDSHQIIGTDNDSSHAINDDNQDSHASINHDSSIDSTSLSRLATRSAETETFSSLNHPDSEL